ncbi:MAG: hypothetical protein WCI88_11155, partial [Chloroflexota bacterium]
AAGAQLANTIAAMIRIETIENIFLVIDPPYRIYERCTRQTYKFERQNNHTSLPPLLAIVKREFFGNVYNVNLYPKQMI